VEELKVSRSLSLEAKGIGEAAIKKSSIARDVIASEAKQSPSIVLPLDAHMPEEYVPNLNNRLSLYHRLGKLEHIEEVADMDRELHDRFGSLPEPVKNLLYIVKMKVLATQAEVGSVSTQSRHIVIKPHTTESPINIRGVTGVMNKYPDGAIRVGATQIRLDTRILGDRWKAVLEAILSCS